MDISTNMETGYILITIIFLLLIASISCMTFSLIFESNNPNNSIYCYKKGTSTKPLNNESISDFVDINEAIGDFLDD